MRIKGTGSGKNKGKPVEFTPQEKPVLIVQEQVPKKAPKGQAWWATDIIVESFTYAAHGETNKKGFASNAYRARGTFNLHQYNTLRPQLMKAVVKNFYAEFHDVVDSTGMPDMATDTFEIT